MAKRLSLMAVLTAILLALSISAQEKAPEGKPQGKILKVTVWYKGGGKVDQTHGVYLFLFDSPDFVQHPGAVMPIAFQATHANDESLTFGGLAASAVYLVAAFDEQGAYDISAGPPPPGTPVALYKPGDPLSPTPVKLEEDKPTEIRFEFDDSLRMP